MLSMSDRPHNYKTRRVSGALIRPHNYRTRKMDAKEGKRMRQYNLPWFPDEIMGNIDRMMRYTVTKDMHTRNEFDHRITEWELKHSRGSNNPNYWYTDGLQAERHYQGAVHNMFLNRLKGISLTLEQQMGRLLSGTEQEIEDDDFNYNMYRTSLRASA